MLLSSACEYGLRTAVYVASLEEDGHVPIRRISEALEISAPFLTKILQQLTENGHMTSLRGPKGGVAFARPPSQITIADVVTSIDGDGLFTECVLGLPGCGNAAPCPLHDRWGAERDRIAALFSSLTLADLAADVNRSDEPLRLAPTAIEL
ncbi:MAG: Rrf2 family transcriptional regulator [Rhodothermales bacterium]